MTAIIYYYSRSGTTEKIAKELAKKLKCEAEIVDDGVNRAGPFGLLKTGFHAMKKKESKLKPLSHKPSNYDLVLIGTPIWGGNMSAPIRSLIMANKKKIKAAAFFSTSGGPEEQKCFASMEDSLGKPPVAKLHLGKQEIKDGYAPKMKRFLKALEDGGAKKKASGE
jgi:flavodoxin